MRMFVSGPFPSWGSLLEETILILKQTDFLCADRPEAHRERRGVVSEPEVALLRRYEAGIILCQIVLASHQPLYLLKSPPIGQSGSVQDRN